MPIPPQAPLEPPFHPAQQPRHQLSSIQERGVKRPRLLPNTEPEAPTTAQSDVAYWEIVSSEDPWPHMLTLETLFE
jgi:hypothetical protein